MDQFRCKQSYYDQRGEHHNQEEILSAGEWHQLTTANQGNYDKIISADPQPPPSAQPAINLADNLTEKKDSPFSEAQLKDIVDGNFQTENVVGSPGVVVREGQNSGEEKNTDEKQQQENLPAVNLETSIENLPGVNLETSTAELKNVTQQEDVTEKKPQGIVLAEDEKKPEQSDAPKGIVLAESLTPEQKEQLASGEPPASTLKEGQPHDSFTPEQKEQLGIKDEPAAETKSEENDQTEKQLEEKQEAGTSEVVSEPQPDANNSLAPEENKEAKPGDEPVSEGQPDPPPASEEQMPI